LLSNTDDEDPMSLVFKLLGKSEIIGTAQVNRPILIQKGSHIFQLMVAAAKVGPMNDTTYEAELMYEK
jgi:hypothetical protein